MKKTLRLSSRIGLNVFAVLCGAGYLLGAIAMENQGYVNSLLHEGGTIVKDKEDQNENDPSALEYFKSDYDSVSEVMEAGKETCSKVLEEGSVLLKNDNGALPLKEGHRRVSLFGTTSAAPVYSGSGSGSMDASTASSFPSSFEKAGIDYNRKLYQEYLSYGKKYNSGVGVWSKIQEKDFSTVTTASKEDMDYSDAAIYVIGRTGGENIDLSPSKNQANMFNSGNDFLNGNYLSLNNAERKTLEGLKALKDKGIYSKIIVILNSANQIETDFLYDEGYGIDACIWIGDVGTSGLDGVAKILTGEVNPSGRLSEIFYNRHCFNPVLSNFGRFAYSNGRMATKNSNSDNYLVYQEGIYIGYRYAETRYYEVEKGNKTAGDFSYDEAITYPFGYGLSYTSFSKTDFKVEYDKKQDAYLVSCTVKNEGNVPGREVVQVYLSKPYTDYDKENGIEKPAVEISCYGKTRELQPGEKETISMIVDRRSFASYDSYNQKTYLLENGTYRFILAENSHDAVDRLLGDDTQKMKSVIIENVDWKTYSRTKNTDYDITNLFDHADINRYDGSCDQYVNYISRNDFNETVKLGVDANGNLLNNNVSLFKTDKMKEDMKIDCDGLIEEDDIEYPTYDAEHKFNLIDLMKNSEGEEISYDDPFWDELLDQLSWDETVELLRDGLRLTSGISSIVKPRTKEHNGPCGVVGGNSYTYGDDSKNNRGLAVKRDDPDKDKSPICYPSNGMIASTFDDALAGRVGVMIGEDALWAGYNGIYGLGLNIRRCAYQGRAFEYYSEDPYLVGKMVTNETLGVQSKGCYVYNKHLVLNDQECNRNGISTWVNEQTMREIYLKPFQMAIEDGNAFNIMSAFNRLGVYWCGEDYNLLTVFLRKECGMKGFVVTDWFDSGYMGLGSGIMAGNDLPDGTRDASELNKYKTGYGAVAWAMRESAHRILYTVVHSNAMNGIDNSMEIIVIPPKWPNTLKTVEVVLTVLFSASLLYYVSAEVLIRVKKMK